MRISVAVALLASITFAGCGSSDADDAADRPPGRSNGLHLIVCEAADAADAGDEAGAKGSFEDAHAGLHELAAAAEEIDRTVAARLLEAKQAVEAGADHDDDEYTALLRAVEDALEAIGDDVGKCPE